VTPLMSFSVALCDWARRQRSAAVEAPGVIIPTENSLLLNPGHPQFAGIAVSEPVRFRFDPAS
jgi:hypothetical protein